MKDWIEKNQITEVECIIPDIAGAARGKIMPASKFVGTNTLRMPQSVFMQSVTGDYPHIWEQLNPLDVDMILKPDPSTLRLLPWAREPSAQVIHDCYNMDDKPIEFAPRQVLRRVLDVYAAEGWKPVVAPELEFYLLQPNLDPRNDLLPPIGRTGRMERAGQSFNIDAVNDFEPMFDDMYNFCAGQGLEIDTLIHEEGMGQMEINLLHGDPLDLADQAFLFKRTVREAALRHDLYATFMAKPMEDQPGSAMHIHQSVEDINSGENIFSTPEGMPNELLLSHIAGLQRYLPEAMALMTPYVNSYRRIVKELREVLGDLFVEVYVGVKEAEFDNFLNVISPWEREHLLLKV